MLWWTFGENGRSVRMFTRTLALMDEGLDDLRPVIWWNEWGVRAVFGGSWIVTLHPFSPLSPISDSLQAPTQFGEARIINPIK
jgi:hypothetical protein